jgi:hypothetical protein
MAERYCSGGIAVEKKSGEAVYYGTIQTNLAALSCAMSSSSAICFGIFDQDLRFRAVNQVLAATHGISAEQHIGTNLHDIVGELAVQAAPALRHVLRTGRESYFETFGKLPNGEDMRCWVNHIFPVEFRCGKIQQVGVLAVEITELRKLDELYTHLASSPLAKTTEYEMALSKELHRCAKEYKTALGLNLASLSNAMRDPERVVEWFTHSLRLLDERIEELSLAIANSFAPSRSH